MQIQVEAKFIDVKQSDLEKLNSQWAFGSQKPQNVASQSVTNDFMKVAGALTAPQVKVMMDALMQKGLTNLRSTPRVTIMSGEKATILITRGYVFEISPKTSADKETINLDFSFEVVNPKDLEKLVLMDVSILQPLPNSRRIQTNVTIWDAQTVLLGGLIHEDATQMSDKNSSNEVEGKERTLLIFLTARVVDSAGKPLNDPANKSTESDSK